MARREPRAWLDTDVHPDYAEHQSLDDLLRQEGVLPALGRTLILYLLVVAITAAAAFAIGYFGRHTGLF